MPSWAVTEGPPRSVVDNRAATRRGSSGSHVFTPHTRCGHSQPCVLRTNLLARPSNGRFACQEVVPLPLPAKHVRYSTTAKRATPHGSATAHPPRHRLRTRSRQGVLRAERTCGQRLSHRGLRSAGVEHHQICRVQVALSGPVRRSRPFSTQHDGGQSICSAPPRGLSARWRPALGARANRVGWR
jgi:hypothetical protein